MTGPIAGMPAVSMSALPGRVHDTLALAKEIEERGFAGIYSPGVGDMSLCLSLAHVTDHIPFGATVQPIYNRAPEDTAEAVGYIHEVSGGRFYFGIGVSHVSFHGRMALPAGRPLDDVRTYVERLRRAGERSGQLPPIVLAALRDNMVKLSVEVADGAVWANGSLSYMAHSLPLIPQDRIDAGFFVGNMIPTVVDDDRAAAAATLRRNLTMYMSFPNYRRYWRAAGYVEEMDAIEQAVEAGDRDRLPSLMSDRWLADCTLSGTVSEVRDGLARWLDAGVSTPILVPQSTRGGRVNAFKDLFSAFP
jgi:alkanesulfonate monooxygenase SsuD/methylene tetrahydromethanopterin reductase-like flavin-dependent oxidoreductase (luciferase family)